MTLPMQNDALQQIGAPQEGAVICIGTAHHDVIAAARARVAAIDHELVGTQSRLPRLLVNRLCRCDAVAPVGGGMNVHLDDTRIRRDADHVDALVMGRGVAFDMDGKTDGGGGALRRCDEVEIVLQCGRRRHEDAEPTIAHFD